MSHNIFITDDFQKDRKFSRNINRTNIFDLELNKIGYFNFSEYEYSPDELWYKMTSKSSNSNYRLCPDNYNFLELKEE